LNLDATERVSERALPDGNVSSVDRTVQAVAPKVSSGQLTPVRTALEQVVRRPLILRHGAQTWTLSPDDIAGFVAVDSAVGQGDGVLKVDEARLAPFVAQVARDVDRPATNARFDFKGGQLQAIASAKDGARLDEVATVKAIEAQLPTNRHEIDLPVVAVKPSFGASDAVKLAARDLVATADTTYGDTIANRRFNVELAASRLNGSVVAPGQTFSLNDALGEVSYRSGYKQAYGIARTTEGIETIPSEGGGICQIATTLFHAVFWAGYPVIERNWHLYWIPRYGLPPKGLKGLDATIDQIYDNNDRLLYSVDFKFKNNTDYPLLIQAHTDGNRIRVSLFGAKPRWQVKVMGPSITSVVRADRTAVREPTSTLPAGQQLMVEEAEDGFTATIVRQIVQDGKVKETQTFRSVYQPSRNVWLVGTPGGAATSLTNASIPADQPANVPMITPKPKPAVALRPRH
jgi:vancomycin resistance protein YoaR